MSHHKDTHVQEIRIGDIVTLTHLKKGTLAFALSDSHDDGALAEGIKYLRISMVDKKGYKGQNDNDTYHLSRKDLENLREVCGENAAINNISHSLALRLEYKVRRYDFKSDEKFPDGNIYFIQLAHAKSTNFGKTALKIIFQRSLEQQGIGLNPKPYDFKPDKFKRKPPKSVMHERKASKVSVLDISLSDAFKIGLFVDPLIHEFFEAQGVARLTAAKHLIESGGADLQQAWVKATDGEIPFSFVESEVSEAFIEFMKHMIDERRIELETQKIKLNYPEL